MAVFSDLLKYKDRVWEISKQTCTEFKKLCGALLEVDRLMWSIDRVLALSDWGSAILRGMRSIGVFAFLGLVTEQVVSGSLKDGDMVSLFVGVGLFLFLLMSLVTGWFEVSLNQRKRLFVELLERKTDETVISKTLSLDAGRLNDSSFVEARELAMKRGRPAIERFYYAQTRMIESVAGAVAGFLFTAILDPLLLLLAVISVAPTSVGDWFMEGRWRKHWESINLVERKVGEYLRALSGGAALQIRLFGHADHYKKEYGNGSGETLKAVQVVGREEAAVDMRTRFLGTAILVVVFWRLAESTIFGGDSSYTEVFLLVGSLLSFRSGILRCANEAVFIKRLYRDYGYWRNFLAVEPMLDEKGRDINVVIPEHPVIEFRDVSFAYPSKLERNVLSHFSLTIQGGEKIAFVGDNGSGKSTLAALIAGMYAPQKGSVFVGGVDLETVPQDVWYQNLVCVLQNTKPPRVVIKEVITGSSGDVYDPEAFEQAVQASRVDEFAREFDQQYDARIGTEWPDGVGLSGGQVERITLASALYAATRKKAKIIILDESLAHCDKETRKGFYQHLRQLLQTVIVIAHDHDFLHHFDRVIVLERGRVIQNIQGSDEIKAYKKRIRDGLDED